LIQIKADNTLPPGNLARWGIRRPVGCLQTHEGQASMRKLLVATAVISSLVTPAAAEDKMVVDMSKMTCGELTKLGFQDFAGITMWLSGYYNASVRNTVIDLYQFAQAAKNVKDYCATAPRATVMSGAERALGIKMPRPR
jgi:acid stress chaperone HdeB